MNGWCGAIDAVGSKLGAAFEQSLPPMREEIPVWALSLAFLIQPRGVYRRSYIHH